MYRQLYEDNIRGEELAMFFRQLLRQAPGRLILLLENGKIRRGGSVRDLLTCTSRLHLILFPGYVQELNTDEGV